MQGAEQSKTTGIARTHLPCATTVATIDTIAATVAVTTIAATIAGDTIVGSTIRALREIHATVTHQESRNVRTAVRGFVQH